MSKRDVSIHDFQKLDLRVGTIVEVERVEGTKRLYKVKVDLGELGVRQTVSGLVGYYEPAELANKRIIFLSNLEGKRLAGLDSEGMLLAAEKDGRLALLTVDRDVPNGATVS
ncbi:MAG: methionine--tRNA ligase [Candidatus Bathyarchaeia archaeon]